MIHTLTPNPSIDRTLMVAGLVLGEVNRATAQHCEPSGKGVNVSRALATNKVAGTAVLPLGGDDGDQLARLLTAEGVRFRAVPIAGATRVNVSLTAPDGSATKINAPGPMLSPTEVATLTSALADLIEAGDWVVAAGSLPGGIAGDYYARVGELVHRRGAMFALDSSGESLTAGLASRPEVIKPNVVELAEATGQSMHNFGDVYSAANYLIGLGARAVVVSLGAAGAMLVNPEGNWYAKGDPVAVVSTIGAGDALLAGFIAAGGFGPEALIEAVAWATAAVTVSGSHVPEITALHRSTIRLSAAPEPSEPVNQGQRKN